MTATFHGLSPDKWPEPDRCLWSRALQKSPLLEADAIATHWRLATVGMVAEAYGYALNWLKERDGIDPTVSLTQRWKPEVIRRYISDLEKRLRPMSVKMRIVRLERALAAMEPSGDRSVLRHVIQQLRPIPDSSRKRNRLQSAATLVNLGMSMMQQATQHPLQSGRKNATVFRDGFQIALLALRPLRNGNFSKIEIGVHLVKVGDHWRLQFAPSETKGRRRLDFAFPEVLYEALDTYLRIYRPLLCGTIYRGNRLWVSFHYTAQAQQSIQIGLSDRTDAAFGKPINPHLFRDCVATSIAIEDPAHVRIAAAVLGHSCFATTQKHYNLAQTLEAARSYNSVIGALRRRERKSPKR